MVLDAVARIEECLAAQRQPAPKSGLAEALTAISRALEEARGVASAALDSLALEENLAPVRKSARVIKEISWRWREIGADGRICDLLDSQVSAIEAGCGRISSAAPRAALSAAFDLIAERIDEFDESDAAPSQAAEEAIRSPSPSPALSDDMLAAAVEAVQAANAENDAEAAPGKPATVETAEAVVMTAEAIDVMVEVPDAAAEARDAASEAARANPEAADAFDDALLDMIALEMAAPDPSDAGDILNTGIYEVHVHEPPPAGSEIAAEKSEPAAAPVQLVASQPPHPPSLEVSLGSTLIANGIVRRPHAAMSDPLAPIRRMSQAEKIAFFS